MKAYITYLCTDSFAPGVLALHNSIKRTKSKYDFVVMITEDISNNLKEKFLNKGIKLTTIKKIFYKGPRIYLMKDRFGIQNESWKMFTKLNLWNQTKYEKLIYIDADALVLKNIEDLFTIGELGAVKDESIILNYQGINAGVLIIKPNKNTFAELISYLNKDQFNITMTDQSLVNDFFKIRKKINIIPEYYNRLWKKNINYNGCHIFHFNGPKPWLHQSSFSNIPRIKRKLITERKTLNLWYDYYLDSK